MPVPASFTVNMSEFLPFALSVAAWALVVCGIVFYLRKPSADDQLAQVWPTFYRQPAAYANSLIHPCVEPFQAGAFVCDICGVNNYFSLVILDEEHVTDAQMQQVHRRLAPSFDGKNSAIYPEHVTCEACQTVYALKLPGDDAAPADSGTDFNVSAD